MKSLRPTPYETANMVQQNIKRVCLHGVKFAVLVLEQPVWRTVASAQLGDQG